LQLHLEFLAQEEHDGWMDHKLRNNWQRGPRNDAARTHDNLIPYRNLPSGIQQFDRNAVLQFPETVNKAGFKVVRMGTTSPPLAKAT
jgi:hypothetical protein